MSEIQIELTEEQWEMAQDALDKAEKEMAYLATLSREQRLAWFQEHQYPHPISFEREIGGTVYTVNAHFSDNATETVEGKAVRILNRNVAHLKC